MKKFTILASTWLLTCLTLSAGSLTPEEALERLSGSMTTRSTNLDNLKHTQTIRLSNGDAGLYIFESKTSEGYAILSADDVAAPLLGYSESGKFDPDRMSPEMKWWLGEYTSQIEYAKTIGAEPYRKLTTRGDNPSIAPLVTTTWNQNYPYNLMTPKEDGRNCVTGCVATAMAQVMKYWNYPTTGTGAATCTVVYKDKTTKQESMLLDEQNFDWNNMLDSYDENATEEQKLAVAYLMKACGYSTQMKYSLDQSGTDQFNVATALITNFGYNKNLQYRQRVYYSASDWSDMVYSELAAGRPVVYGGQSINAGHCFVCDGYDSNGYYHFNWGWGGMSDGYFILDALNPGSLGIGANGGGYNFRQCAVIGIQPELGEEYAPLFAQQGTMQGAVSGITISLTCRNENTESKVGGWYNLNTETIIIDLGLKIEPISPTAGETIYTALSQYKNLKYAEKYGLSKVDFLPPSSLADGNYRATLCFRLSGTESWTPVMCESDDYNYIEFSKTKTKFAIIPTIPAKPEIKSAEILTPLYFENAVRMSVTVSNPAGKEITNYFYPVLYSGINPQMKAEGVAISIAPGETVTKEFLCMFELTGNATAPTEDTAYQLQFYNPANSDSKLEIYEGFSKEVTMKIDNNDIDITIDNFTITGCETYSESGVTYYEVTDPSLIPFTLTFTNNADFFAKAIELMIFPKPEAGESVINLAEEAFTPMELLNKGESATVGANVNFSAGEMGKSYLAIPIFSNQMYSKNGIYFTLSDPNGVENVEATEITIVYDKTSAKLRLSAGVSRVVVTSMDGTLYDKSIEAASGTVDLGNLAAGVYIVKAIASDGTAKAIKILK